MDEVLAIALERLPAPMQGQQGGIAAVDKPEGRSDCLLTGVPSVKCTSVEFVVSARSTADYPKERRPEIAVAGRSNVGKSSLINALLKRKQVARVSATPGKTRGINYFVVNSSFFLVDLPGYGYARISRDEQRQWERMVRDYLHCADRPKLVLVLVDSRHPPSPLDLALGTGWLARAWST